MHGSVGPLSVVSVTPLLRYGLRMLFVDSQSYNISSAVHAGSFVSEGGQPLADLPRIPRMTRLPVIEQLTERGERDLRRFVDVHFGFDEE